MVVGLRVHTSPVQHQASGFHTYVLKKQGVDVSFNFYYKSFFGHTYTKKTPKN